MLNKQVCTYLTTDQPLPLLQGQNVLGGTAGGWLSRVLGPAGTGVRGKLLTHLLCADEVLGGIEGDWLSRGLCLVGDGVRRLQDCLGVDHLLHQHQPGVQELP